MLTLTELMITLTGIIAQKRVIANIYLVYVNSYRN